MAKKSSWIALAGFGAAVAGAAWLGARNSPRNLRTRLWYQRLDQPPFNPPDAVFPVVWSILYALIAVSGWRVWQQPDSPSRRRALALWATQLGLNTAWTRLFFGAHRPALALADVLAMEAAILAYVRETTTMDAIAAACFLPYAGWVAFAALLNAEIVRRNPKAASLLPRPEA
jgi:translocator protein